MGMSSLFGGKRRLRKLFFVRLILIVRKKIRNKKADILRAPYIPDLVGLINNDTSIISSNCFAGRVMQDLRMQYNSPTLGLYFFADDYMEFLTHLKYYLTEAKIEFIEKSRYSLANSRRDNWEHWYPIGLLGGKVEIQFLHYYSEEEAASKWYRRASRVNWDKLLIIGMEQNLCTLEHIKNFNMLPFVNKYFFSSKQLSHCKSNIYVDEFREKGEVGDPYLKGYIFYRYLIERLKQE